MFESEEDNGDAVIAVLPARPERPETDRRPREREQTRTKTKTEPNYHVIIWNDEEHSYDYVIRLMMTTFGHSHAKAFDITWEVDHAGKAIACTCHRELAELKCEQVLAFGADPMMPQVSKGSMRATIEPVPE